MERGMLDAMKSADRDAGSYGEVAVRRTFEHLLQNRSSTPTQSMIVAEFGRKKACHFPVCWVMNGTLECTAKGSRVIIRDYYTGRRQRTSIKCGVDCKFLCVSEGYPEDVVFSGDSEGSLKKWSVHTAELLHRYDGHEKMICSLVYHSDERAMFTGSADRTIRKWNLKTGECTRIMAGHTMVITCLALCAKDGMVFSGSGDQTVKKWNAKNGKLIGTMSGHEMPVAQIEVREAENRIVTTEWGGVNTKIFSLDTGVEIHGEPPNDASTTVILL